jgi:hypothetical protein
MAEAPIGQELLLANDSVRVWLDVVASGERQPVHTHRSPYLSVMVTDAKARVLDGAGAVVYEVDRRAGESTWFGAERVPTTHTLENVGDEEIKVVIVEVLADR